MEATLKRIVQYVDASVVYTTPYACVWNAYCDSLVHSLVVGNRTQDTALIVYSYNELTLACVCVRVCVCVCANVCM